jgi:hypothetical protein
MHPFLAKTIGGLSASGYIRHFLFGMLFPAFALAISSTHSLPTPWNVYVIFAVNTLLYPYARHAYETIVDYILGSNIIVTNLGFALIVKIVTMLLCWGGAIVIAPVGLLCLYFQNSNERGQG